MFPDLIASLQIMESNFNYASSQLHHKPDFNSLGGMFNGQCPDSDRYVLCAIPI